MFKSVISKLLRIKTLEQKLKNFYSVQNGLSSSEIEAIIANGEIWLFSQMKTGTTFLCNVLAFYNANINGLHNIHFGNIENAGIGRGSGIYSSTLSGLMKFRRDHRAHILIHTHNYLPNCAPEFLVCTTRNPMDYAVSYYYFHYINRKNINNMVIDDVLPKIINNFIKTYKMQSEAAKKCEKVIKIRYEELMTDTSNTISNLIRQIYTVNDESAIQKAIKHASPENLKRFEREQGQAIVAKAGTLKKQHFIRSGKIGEGKDFFTIEQQQLIANMLEVENIPISGDFNF